MKNNCNRRTKNYGKTVTFRWVKTISLDTDVQTTKLNLLHCNTTFTELVIPKKRHH